MSSSFWKSISLFLDVHKTLLARGNPRTTTKATMARNILRFPTSFRFITCTQDARRLCRARFCINTYQSFDVSCRMMHTSVRLDLRQNLRPTWSFVFNVIAFRGEYSRRSLSIDDYSSGLQLLWANVTHQSISRKILFMSFNFFFWFL